jgi:hypothetical protein
MPRARIPLSIVVAALVGVSAAARAEDKDSEKVAALCQQAYERAQSRDFAAARELYAQAMAIAPNLTIEFNLGLAELRSGRPLDALVHLRAYAKDPHAEPSKVAVANADLLPKALAATGHISLSQAPKAAVFYLDGKALVNQTDPVLDVVPGKYAVVARTRDAAWAASVDAPVGTTATPSFHIVYAASATQWPPRDFAAVDGGASAGSSQQAPADAGGDVAWNDVRR